MVIAAMVALQFAGMLAGVAFKTCTQQCHVEGEPIRDQAEPNARQIRHQEALADEFAVKAHAAQVEVDIKAGLPSAMAGGRLSQRGSRLT